MARTRLRSTFRSYREGGSFRQTKCMRIRIDSAFKGDGRAELPPSHLKLCAVSIANRQETSEEILSAAAPSPSLPSGTSLPSQYRNRKESRPGPSCLTSFRCSTWNMGAVLRDNSATPLFRVEHFHFGFGWTHGIELIPSRVHMQSSESGNLLPTAAYAMRRDCASGKRTIPGRGNAFPFPSPDISP